MQNYIFAKPIAVFILSLVVATPAFALTVGINANASASTSAGGVGISAALETRINTAKEHADQEITRRINSLNDLNGRVQGMVKLTGQAKANIGSSVQTQVNSLTELKAKIAADTDIEVLKADIKSITASYRVFLLVIPQGHITVASDKIKYATDAETSLTAKFSARIDAAASAGANVTSLKTALADMQAKIADANAQADASVALVANLTPDNGDKTKETANQQALKDARAKIKAGVQDVVAARKDAHTIVEALIKLNAHASASTTTP